MIHSFPHPNLCPIPPPTWPIPLPAPCHSHADLPVMGFFRGCLCTAMTAHHSKWWPNCAVWRAVFCYHHQKAHSTAKMQVPAAKLSMPIELGPKALAKGCHLLAIIAFPTAAVDHNFIPTSAATLNLGFQLCNPAPAHVFQLLQHTNGQASSHAQGTTNK